MSGVVQISPQIRRNADGTAQALAIFPAPISLLFIGDITTIQFSFIEQLVGITTFNYDSTGETNQRTLTQDFRWKNEGGAWSSWATLSNINLQAVAPDEDLAFYLEVRLTRSGASTTGIITYDRVAFSYTYNSQSVVGYGRISQENIYGDCKAFWLALVASWLWQVNGGDHYEVVYSPREWRFSTIKPAIYMHSLAMQETQQMNIGTFRQFAQITMGLKGVKNKTQGYDQMLSRLYSCFHPFNIGESQWTFTFKGVDYIAASFMQLGIRTIETSGHSEFWDSEANEMYNEFTVNFSIDFLKFAPI